MKLYAFYHLWVGGDWKRVLDEYIGALRQSGLLGTNETSGALTTLFITFIGKLDDRSCARDHLRSLNVTYETAAEADSGYEQVSIHALHKFAKENDGAILYAHGKGCYNKSDISEGWRRNMTYHNIIKWKETTAYLDESSCAGCMLFDPATYGRPDQRDYYAGNFWWARCDYLRLLPICSNESRYDAENWIGLDLGFNGYDVAPADICLKQFITLW